ncbi:MAG: TetR family transcriptional regulator [Rhizobiales bacterium]|nr:TetR family transcriptional regulator [Hyphomicrobiales bacterium]
MTFHDDDEPQKRRGYHHGNLREALIAAARMLIGEKGASGFTFAEAARLAGVSPAAPYRHFKDKDDLLADVARQGFDRFEAALQAAWDGGRPNPLAAFDRLGRAYLRFASEHPADYQAMFEAGIAITPGTPLAHSSDRAFNVLRTAVSVLVETLPAANRPPVMMMSLHIWSLTHGIASLFLRGDGARRKAPISAEELLESALLIYLQGLGFGSAGGPR